MLTSCLFQNGLNWALLRGNRKAVVYFLVFFVPFFVQAHVRQSHGPLLVPVNAAFFSCATMAYAEVDLGCEGVWHPTSLGSELSGGLLPTAAASNAGIL